MSDVLNDGAAADRRLDDFDRSQSTAVLLYAKNPAKPGYASALGMEQFGGAGGGGGGASEPAPVETYAPDVLPVGAQEVALAVPEGANRALVTVTAGAAQIGLGAAATAPSYGVGEGVQVSGAQLAALRLVRDGSADATVRADFWREA